LRSALSRRSSTRYWRIASGWLCFQALFRVPSIVPPGQRTHLDSSIESRRHHWLSAIAQELIRTGGRTVSVWSCVLLAAKRDLKLSRVLKRFSKCEVLLIDDIGYV
jgi:hypothetical protein